MSPLPAIGQILPSFSAMPTALADRVASGAGPISPAELKSLALPDGLSSVSVAQPAGATDAFSNVLGRIVSEVNAKQALAGDTVNAMQSGQNVPLHQAVIAMEEASVSFQLMIEVRNKLLESYQELMRMQL